MSGATEIERAAALLKAGDLVAFPTETVYGLGVDATSDQAVAKLYATKARPRFNPLIAHVAETAQAVRLGRFSTSAQHLAERFWPGPLTLVVDRQEDCPVSLLASAGLGSIALRIPRHDMALALLRVFGGPVVAPSANPSGRLSPTEANHVRAMMGDTIAMVLDGGDCGFGVESTIISCLDDEPQLLRAGALPRDQIEKVLGRHLSYPERQSVPHAPGQLESHYAPRAALRLNVTEPASDEVFIGFGQVNHGPFNLSPKGDTTEAAANLFRLLHAVDAKGASKIAIGPIPFEGLGEAINDRLSRAAAPRPL